MRHIERQHAVDLPLPIERVFPLFTPKGEMDWVDDWNPKFLHPESGETRAGMVFTTHGAGEETLWSCIEWAPEEHRVRYARVTPGSRFGFVQIECSAAAPARTEVTVTYAFTALSDAGQAYLAAVTESAFAAMIEDWKRRIHARIIAA